MKQTKTIGIAYRKGYKYQLAEDYTIQTQMFPLNEDVMVGNFIVLTKGGTLTLAAGYAWNGPSGLTVDTANFMRGSLVHDAFYQLLRAGHGRRVRAEWRKIADDELRRICLEDGMSRFRAWYVWWSVRRLAASAASPANRKTIFRAGRQ